jgi:hypothetical protein
MTRRAQAGGAWSRQSEGKFSASVACWLTNSKISRLIFLVGNSNKTYTREKTNMNRIKPISSLDYRSADAHEVARWPVEHL